VATKLEKPLKRELNLDGEPYIVMIGPEGLKITQKGHRKGVEFSWKDLLRGDTGLAAALRASVDNPPQ
jgi:hypothetical protein